MNTEKIQHTVSQAKQLHITNYHTYQSRSVSETILDMSQYAGIIEYRPEELVISVKAGTAIKNINQLLSDNNQTTPFYAPNNSSIGAAYAIGSPELSDAILGIKIIDGQGRLLNFGGQVMKNVAGYDVSRLLVGSRGLLAVICEISFKVLPTNYIKTPTNSILSTSGPSSSTATAVQRIEQGLKKVFDPNNIFI